MTEKKRGRPTKLAKRDKKFRNALEAGIRVAEISSSKIAWDIGHGKMEVRTGNLGYREHQILDCATYKIAQGYWFGYTLGMRDKPDTEEPERFIVIIPYSEFVRFINAKHKPKTKEVAEMFKNVGDITLDGEVRIPFCLADGNWLMIEDYLDNICGVAIAREGGEYDKYRSDRKLRGKGKGKEEPVFILLFSSAYGLVFFRNSMHREGVQLLDPALYRLQPEAQVLYQSIRWKRDLIFLSTEQISKTVGWVWSPKNFRDRIYRIRKLLKILHDNGFINKVVEHGKTWETKAWAFYVRKGKRRRQPEKIIGFRQLRMKNKNENFSRKILTFRPLF